MEKVEILGTAAITGTIKDINDWRQDEMVFTFFCLAYLALGIVSILLDFPVWCTTLCAHLCFIALAVCLAGVIYSNRKVTNLKRRLRKAVGADIVLKGLLRIKAFQFLR